jgi:hypothetical protein
MDTKPWFVLKSVGMVESNRDIYAAQHLAALRRIALNILKKMLLKKLPVGRKRMLAALARNDLEAFIGIYLRLPWGSGVNASRQG